MIVEANTTVSASGKKFCLRCKGELYVACNCEWAAIRELQKKVMELADIDKGWNENLENRILSIAKNLTRRINELDRGYAALMNNKFGQDFIKPRDKVHMGIDAARSCAEKTVWKLYVPYQKSGEHNPKSCEPMENPSRQVLEKKLAEKNLEIIRLKARCTEQDKVLTQLTDDITRKNSYIDQLDEELTSCLNKQNWLIKASPRNEQLMKQQYGADV